MPLFQRQRPSVLCICQIHLIAHNTTCRFGVNLQEFQRRKQTQCDSEAKARSLWVVPNKRLTCASHRFVRSHTSKQAVSFTPAQNAGQRDSSCPSRSLPQGKFWGIVQCHRAPYTPHLFLGHWLPSACGPGVRMHARSECLLYSTSSPDKNIEPTSRISMVVLAQWNEFVAKCALVKYNPCPMYFLWDYGQWWRTDWQRTDLF